MDEPAITARYDMVTASVHDVDFSVEDPLPENPLQRPKVRARFKKLLEFAMPYHAAQYYPREDITPERIAACIETFLDNLTIHELSQLVWSAIDDHYDEIDQEMPSA